VQRRYKHEIPGIHSSAVADLSFLLLIFFIVTISLEPAWVMPTRLSPPVPENRQTAPIKIKERDFLPIYIDDENRIFCRSIAIKATELRTYAKHFIENPDNDNDLPEKIATDIPLLGTVDITQRHIIALSNGEKTSFQAYIFVQNELIAAYNELREELSRKKFGKSYNALTTPEQEAVRGYYPRKISRPEKTDKGGRS
jgi:biopolymer transport protein ExbD